MTSTPEAVMLMVRVSRMYLSKQPGATKAFADIVVAEEYIIRGIRVVEGEKGLFVSMPGRETKDGAFVLTFEPMGKAKELVRSIVMAQYKIALKGAMGAGE